MPIRRLSTLAPRSKFGIPTRSSLSKDTEVVPKILTICGLGRISRSSPSVELRCSGSDDDNGLKTFEYGLVFGYTIPRKEYPQVPDVLQFVPVFELIRDAELNHADPGHNSLMGSAVFASTSSHRQRAAAAGAGTSSQ